MVAMPMPKEIPPASFSPVSLEGRRVRLEPLERRHEQELIDASKDGELWRLWYTNVPEPSRMLPDIEKRLRALDGGQMLPFVIIDKASSTVVGMTNYLNIDLVNIRVEIGGTWHAGRVQRSPINTEAKFLLLSHAFEMLECIAVEFRTHFMNHSSRRAIERLGAKLDGVLRSNQRARDGTLRDTCVYSIIASEWPAVRSHLRWQLDKPRD